MTKKQSKSNNTYCVMCGLNTIADTTIEKTTSIKYEGKLYEISVSDLIVLRCGECGEIYLDNRADRQISRALRLHLGLLQPEDILKMQPMHALRSMSPNVIGRGLRRRRSWAGWSKRGMRIWLSQDKGCVDKSDFLSVYSYISFHTPQPGLGEVHRLALCN